jgi:hypothetical protein
MTRDDIVRLREECDQWAEWHLQCVGEYHPDFHTVSDERFAALVAAREREACAKVCENEGARIDASWTSCAFAIRARGNP